jgi:hypothetical protein
MKMSNSKHMLGMEGVQVEPSEFVHTKSARLVAALHEENLHRGI